ncbi:hypothetical protein J6590_058111 [Homalodisca vitripennis]|nr:hypothetical protein J6590_058111 [Homalodisca vitripennis]
MLPAMYILFVYRALNLLYTGCRSHTSPVASCYRRCIFYLSTEPLTSCIKVAALTRHPSHHATGDVYLSVYRALNLLYRLVVCCGCFWLVVCCGCFFVSTEPLTSCIQVAALTRHPSHHATGDVYFICLQNPPPDDQRDRWYEWPVVLHTTDGLCGLQVAACLMSPE